MSAGPSSPGAAGSAERLRRLGETKTGAKAVADSQAIYSGSDEFFMGGARRGARVAGAPRITRRASDRTFYLVDGVWIDRRRI